MIAVSKFSKKLQKQELAQKDLESLKCFFSSIVSFQTLPLKPEIHPFSSPNICSSFPNLLEYKDTKNLTHSEKYLSHLDSLSALEKQLDSTPKKIDMLNSNIKKLQTDMQTQNTDSYQKKPSRKNETKRRAKNNGKKRMGIPKGSFLVH